MPYLGSLSRKKLQATDIDALKESFQIEKFEKSVLTVFASIFANLLKLFRRKKPDRNFFLKEKGAKRSLKALDVATFIRTEARLKSLEQYLFSKQQK